MDGGINYSKCGRENASTIKANVPVFDTKAGTVIKTK